MAFFFKKTNKKNGHFSKFILNKIEFKQYSHKTFSYFMFLWHLHLLLKISAS